MKETKLYLINKGKENKEAFVLWTGIQNPDNSYSVNNLLIPYQIADKNNFGYSFDIPGKSISEIIQVLYNSGEIGLIQVHSHPGASARHSLRDDTLSILNRSGALSIVLPYFGNIEFNDFSNCLVHVNVGINKWDVLPYSKVKEIVKILR
jgi:hypothetical protein